MQQRGSCSSGAMTQLLRNPQPRGGLREREWYTHIQTLVTLPTLWPPLLTSLAFNGALPAFEVVLVKGRRKRSRDPSFLLEVTMGLVPCNLVPLCVLRRVCHGLRGIYSLGSAVVR